MLTTGTLLQNRYRITRLIGRGGMGAVYEARHEELGHIVALKETLHTDDEGLRKAFRREARLLAGLRHPSLPRVTDYFTEGDGLFLVMEYVHGEDLATLLKRRGAAFPVEDVLKWAAQLLNVLVYLHNYDPPIIHRDIKPSNIKLTAEGEIILLDFGLAKGAIGEMSSVVTSRSVPGFTLTYSPLEQILKVDQSLSDHLSVFDEQKIGRILQGSTDARSDLYSVGVTLYHLITGKSPAQAPTRALALWSGRPDPLLAADEVNKAVPPFVAEALKRAVAIDIEERPTSASEMRRLLSGGDPSEPPVIDKQPEDAEPTKTLPASSGFQSQLSPHDPDIKPAPAQTSEPEKKSEPEPPLPPPPHASTPRVARRPSSAVRQSARDRRHVLLLAGLFAVLAGAILTVLFLSGVFQPKVERAKVESAGSNLNEAATPSPAPTDEKTVRDSAANQAGASNTPLATPVASSTPLPAPTVEPNNPGANLNKNSTDRNAPSNSAPTPTGQQQQKSKQIFLSGRNESQPRSGVTIVSDTPLNDYSAYRSGDRFYIVIPKANANSMPRGTSGRGFSDMKVEQRGNDLVLSYKLRPGVKPRVNQRFDRLDVVFDEPRER